MSTITFDTLEATRKLRDAGFDEKQAEAVVRVLSDTQNQLVTREYLDGKLQTLEMRLTIKLGAMLAVMGGVIIAVLSIPK